MHAANQDPPGQTAVSNWANNNGITNHPVLVDANGDSYRLANGYPTYVVLDRDMTIRIQDLYPFNASTVASVISEQ